MLSPEEEPALGPHGEGVRAEEHPIEHILRRVAYLPHHIGGMAGESQPSPYKPLELLRAPASSHGTKHVVGKNIGALLTTPWRQLAGSAGYR